jgi:hypothetical protein
MKQSTRRLLTHGTNASLVTVMVIGVLVLLYVLADNFRQRIDLSEGGQNTLQAETVDQLRLLDSDGQAVTITAFTAQRGKDDSYFKDRAVKDLLKELGAQSTAIEWRQVDFDKERLTAEKLGVGDYGRIVVQRGKDRVDIKDRELFRRTGKGADRKLEFVGEAAIARGFAQLMTDQRQVVYILTGHGDLDPGERGPDGLSQLAEALDQERYDVETLDLLRSDRDGELPTVPDDAAVVFVARPQQALTPQEEDSLLAWIGRGGAVLFAVDVGAPVPGMLGRMGLTVPDGVALQPEMQVPYRDRPIPVYKRHPITMELLEEKVVSVLAHPAPLRMLDPLPEGVRASAVLSSTRDGWIDRGGALVGGGAVYEKEIDGAGPVDLAIALELLPGRGLVRSSKPVSRILVVGDGDVFTNAVLGEAPGNAPLALNAIHWLAGEDRRLGVTVGTVGRATRSRRLALTQEELGMLRIVTLGFMPFVVLLFGIGTWFARRGR